VWSAERKVRLADGRQLQLLEVGPPDSDPVFVLHGTPGVLKVYAPHIEQGVRRGLRHVLYLRPGYGESDRQPGRSVADCAADIGAIADALGIGRFYVIGESGGAPHALACAALLPNRVRAVALIGAVAPYGAKGLDWWKDMGEGNRREFKAALRGGAPVLREYLERETRKLRSVENVAQLRAALDGHLCDADRAAIDGDFGEFVLASWRFIGEDKIWGWLDDDLSFMEDWEFGVEEATAPVSIWQGGADRMVPVQHAEWLAKRLPNAKLHLLPDAGHISSVSHFGAVLDRLIATAL
jgi:pimeloyl-ACP methyl ester carboxylesterase